MLFEAQSALPIWAIKHIPAVLFVVAFGACVGSFLNVVIYRLPAGISVISPPSRCPVCGARLTFFRDNLPVLGWLFLRGKCRYCHVRIPPQYMIVELAMALFCLALYLLLFAARPDSTWWSMIGNNWWYQNQFFQAWPAFLLVVFLFAGLLAMTVIDARTFTIPIQIPVFVTVAAFIMWPLQAMLPMRRSIPDWPITGVDSAWAGAALLGLVGMAIAMLLLRMKVVKYSFADYYDFVDPEATIGEYPHARREMVKELAFLAPIVLGLAGGYFLGPMVFGVTCPQVVQALATSVLGYFVGAGMIWGIRILGTLSFGREAMGLGDVHLLGAVGAVVGWYEPVLIFFVAPFSGILWHVLTMCQTWLSKSENRRELPYGPHLAVATVIVFFGRPWLEAGMEAFMRLTMPSAGFVG
jgi:leader peptidase (prepilin peptidase)/N-methyltransferase